MQIHREQFSPLVDRATPIRALGAQTQSEETQSAQKDRGVANSQAKIDKTPDTYSGVAVVVIATVERPRPIRARGWFWL